MPKPKDFLDTLRIAAPCPASWDRMAGDERVRHCTLCDLNVYNFAEMTRDEVRALLMRTEGRVCGRLYRRADGTLLTRDCPVGFEALRRRVSRFGAAVMTALFSVAAFATGCASSEASRLRKERSMMTLEIDRPATPQKAVFAGVVRYDDAALPGATVVIRDEATRRDVTAISDIDGAFNIPSLDDGLYRVEVTFPGFKPMVKDHVLLKQNEVTRARVVLRVDSATVIAGAVAVDDWMRNGVSTTFSQDLLNKLPH